MVVNPGEKFLEAAAVDTDVTSDVVRQLQKAEPAKRAARGVTWLSTNELLRAFLPVSERGHHINQERQY